MTALAQYERLESIGLWRETATAQRREVVVSFGAASLVLSDKNDMPLAHWSLAAVRVLNKGDLPVIYAPDTDAGETLEIDDPLMVEAVAKVRDSLAVKRHNPGRLRWVIAAVVVVAIAGFMMLGLAPMSARYAARVMPEAKKQQIGQALLEKMGDITGPPCEDSFGAKALVQMRDWLLPKGYRLYVVDLGARFSILLPGKVILINRLLLEEYSGPEVAAGFVLMELANAREHSEMEQMFASLGSLATLGFLVNGEISNQYLAQYARKLLLLNPRRPADKTLLAEFARARLTSAPFARALDNSLKTTGGLVAQDPAGQGYRPALKDGDWIALQGICQE